MVINSGASFIRPDQFWRQLGLRGNQTVVHLGCGAGFYLIPAARIVGAKGQAIGVDVRQDMLEETESRARHENVTDIVTTILANLEQGPVSDLPDDSADWTLVANVLYQSDPTKVLAEAGRITKPSGTIVIVEWDIVATPLGPPNEERLSPNDLRQTLKQLGLTVAETFDPSPYHYGFLVKSKSN